MIFYLRKGAFYVFLSCLLAATGCDLTSAAATGGGTDGVPAFLADLVRQVLAAYVL